MVFPDIMEFYGVLDLSEEHDGFWKNSTAFCIYKKAHYF